MELSFKPNTRELATQANNLVNAVQSQMRGVSGSIASGTVTQMQRIVQDINRNVDFRGVSNTIKDKYEASISLLGGTLNKTKTEFVDFIKHAKDSDGVTKANIQTLVTLSTEFEDANGRLTTLTKTYDSAGKEVQSFLSHSADYKRMATDTDKAAEAQARLTQQARLMQIKFGEGYQQAQQGFLSSSGLTDAQLQASYESLARLSTAINTLRFDDNGNFITVDMLKAAQQHRYSLGYDY